MGNIGKFVVVLRTICSPLNLKIFLLQSFLSFNIFIAAFYKDWCKSPIKVMEHYNSDIFCALNYKNKNVTSLGNCF